MPNKKKTYEELMEKFDRKKIEERIEYLILKADTFLENANYNQFVFCDERIITHVVLDYFADIDRLKIFHDIEQVKTDKIIAYTVAWIIQRKPLQFKENSIEERDIFVNERFALFLMVSEMFRDDGEIPILIEGDMKEYNGYMELILYYFKYRECNPKVVELMIESFKMGRFVYKNNVNK